MPRPQHPRVIEAISTQLRTLPSTHTSFFSNQPMEDLATHLVTRAPAGIARAMFVNEGSVAIEAALKLARQYWIERGEPQRDIIVSRRSSYHGNTLGALAIGGNLARQRPYKPLLFPKWCTSRPASPIAMRCRGIDAGLWFAPCEELEAAILMQVQVASPLSCEPVVARPGCVPPVAGYFKRIRDICDRHGVLFIADEIMCGMGRTGTLFALEQEGVAADIITIAKGLGAGYQPIGAVLIHERIVEAIMAGSAALANGHTYMGHAACCAGALAVLQSIEDERLLDNVNRMGDRLHARLVESFGDHPHVGDIRGRGLFRAIELVVDRATGNLRSRFALHARIKRETQQRGLLAIHRGLLTVPRRSRVFAPPYIVNEEQIDTIGDIAAQSIAAVLDALPRHEERPRGVALDA